MIEITEIYETTYQRDRLSYAGTLRNEKKFNLGDDVFFALGNDCIACGKVIGIELPPADNPEYKYKISIPAEIVERRKREIAKGRAVFPALDNVTLHCDRIFMSIEEAHNSALAAADRKHRLECELANRYFRQFYKQEDTTCE